MQRREESAERRRQVRVAGGGDGWGAVAFDHDAQRLAYGFERRYTLLARDLLAPSRRRRGQVVPEASLERQRVRRLVCSWIVALALGLGLSSALVQLLDSLPLITCARRHEPESQTRTGAGSTQTRRRTHHRLLRCTATHERRAFGIAERARSPAPSSCLGWFL